MCENEVGNRENDAVNWRADVAVLLESCLEAEMIAPSESGRAHLSETLRKFQAR